MTPARGLVLVRLADTEETLPGGRILLTQNVREEMASYQVEIVSVGAPEICQDKHCMRDHIGNPNRPPELYGPHWRSRIGSRPLAKGWEAMRASLDTDHAIISHQNFGNLHIGPGAWCVVKHRSFIPSDDPHGKTFYVRQEDVLAVLSVAPEDS